MTVQLCAKRGRDPTSYDALPAFPGRTANVPGQTCGCGRPEEDRNDKQRHDDFAVESRVLGEEDARHAAPAQLTVEDVGRAELLLQLGRDNHRGASIRGEDRKSTRLNSSHR